MRSRCASCTGLTAIAIVLEVAMAAGTFMLTDSIDKAFDSIFTTLGKVERGGVSYRRGRPDR